MTTDTTTATERYISRVLDQLPRNTPRREQIATELRGHIAERAASGMPETDILRQLGDPVSLAESYLSAVPMTRASFVRRALAKLIDVAVAAIALVPPTAVLWMALPPEIAWWAPIFAIVMVSLLFAAYTMIGERQLGQTLGKYLLGLRVVRESGARISLGQAIVRQLPMVLEVFAIDILFALFTERHQRAFELLSRTRVVNVR